MQMVKGGIVMGKITRETPFSVIRACLMCFSLANVSDIDRGNYKE